MTATKKSVLNPLIYMVGGCTMYQGISKYTQALSEGNVIDKIHSTKLQEYLRVLDAPVEKEATQIMKSVLNLVQRVCPHTRIQAYSRVKSFLSFEKKINYTLVEAWKEHKGISYDELISKLITELNYGLNDILAFRFIVHGETEAEAISTIYQIANLLIPEMEQYGLIAQAHQKLKGIAQKDGDDIYLDNRYKDYFKDYIFYKKKNDYQSLHIIFWSITLGRYIEIQFRTPGMDFCAEFGKPSHRDYKSKKYNPDFKDNAIQSVVDAAERLKILQYPKIGEIDIQNFFTYTVDGKLRYFDGAGLIEPLIRKQMVLIDDKIVTVF